MNDTILGCKHWRIYMIHVCINRTRTSISVDKALKIQTKMNALTRDTGMRHRSTRPTDRAWEWEKWTITPLHACMRRSRGGSLRG